MDASGKKKSSFAHSFTYSLIYLFIYKHLVYAEHWGNFSLMEHLFQKGKAKKHKRTTKNKNQQRKWLSWCMLMIVTKQEQYVITCMPCSIASLLGPCNCECDTGKIMWELLEMKNLELHPKHREYNIPSNKMFQVIFMHLKVWDSLL